MTDVAPNRALRVTMLAGTIVLLCGCPEDLEEIFPPDLVRDPETIPPPPLPPGFDPGCQPPPAGVSEEDLLCSRDVFELVEFLRGLSGLPTAEMLCAAFNPADPTLPPHSQPGLSGPSAALDWTEHKVKVNVDPVELSWATPGEHEVSTRSLEDDLPCGADGERVVLCTGDTPFPVGETLVVATVMHAEIPMMDPVHLHQYAFVFDADGDETNNFIPDPAFSNDFFQNTDRWYVASYSPSQGWTMEVSTANGTSLQPATSDARIIIQGHAIMALIPTSEFEVECPGHRVTAFTHLGDYGLDPPHTWGGDVDPLVTQPLQPACG